MDNETNTAVQEQETAIEEQVAETTADEGPVSLDDTVEDGGEAEVELENGDDEGLASETPAEEQFSEIDIDGTTYQIPEQLKAGYMQHADYTRKTQEHAENVRTFETDRKQLEHDRNVSNEELSARAFLQNADQQLEQYKNLDWNKLEDEDPIIAQRKWREYQTLKEQRDGAVGFVEKLQKDKADVSERDTANRIAETYKFAQENIKGWTPEMDTQVTSFADKELGMTKEILKGAITPQVYKALHLAWLGQQSLDKANTAKPMAKITKIKPLSLVSSKTSAGNNNKSPSEMSMDEYAKHSKAKYKE